MDLLILLALIGGVVDILAAALFLVLTSVVPHWLGIIVGPGIVGLVFLFLWALSFLLLFYGATSFVLAYGLWKGRGWAWTWARTSAIIGLALSIIALVAGIGVVGVATNALSIHYLNRPEVKGFFGKASLPESKSTPRPPYVAESFCVHCGNRLNEKEAYCPSCGFKR